MESYRYDSEIKKSFDKLLSNYAKINNHYNDKKEEIEILYKENENFREKVNEIEESQKLLIKHHNKIKKDYDNLLFHYEELEKSYNILKSKIKTITDSKEMLIENFKMKNYNLEEDLSNLLKENNVLQSERDSFKNLYSNLKTSHKDKINKHQHQLEIIEGAFQNKTINFEKILKEKDKKYDELNTLYSSLMDEIETLKNNKKEDVGESLFYEFTRNNISHEFENQESNGQSNKLQQDYDELNHEIYISLKTIESKILQIISNE